ncbi:unnamed protein product [Effrenium voratum]|nr:unnamed protein product [Effrenium voratum]
MSIGEEDFAAAWAERSMDPLGPWNSPGAKEAEPFERLEVTVTEGFRELSLECTLLDLVQSHCHGLPLETLDLEFLVPGHSEALWVRQLYWEHYEEHNAAKPGRSERMSLIERLMHQTQSFTKDASYYSLLQEQCETFSSELYIWRVRWPGPAEAIREAARTMRSQLAWHGASGDVDEQSLKQGELRPGRTLALGPWRLASRPLQTFGKGPQWLYCLAHPSIWHSWPCGGFRTDAVAALRFKDWRPPTEMPTSFVAQEFKDVDGLTSFSFDFLPGNCTGDDACDPGTHFVLYWARGQQKLGALWRSQGNQPPYSAMARKPNLATTLMVVAGNAAGEMAFGPTVLQN